MKKEEDDGEGKGKQGMALTSISNFQIAGWNHKPTLPIQRECDKESWAIRIFEYDEEFIEISEFGKLENSLPKLAHAFIYEFLSSSSTQVNN